LLVGELFEIAEREQIDRILEQQGLGSIVSRLPGEGRVLLVVDQFEEVFTQCQDRQERQRFIDCLTSVRQSDNSRLVVVTTMRADFVDRWLTSGVLTQAIQDDALFLGVLAGANLEDAIEQPSAIQGYHLQPGLLELILRDVANEENCLPLLEFALTELWEKRDRSNQLLTVADYKSLGGLVGALDRHAEDIYQDLAARGQGEWVQRVMLRLVRTGERMRDTRHRRSKTELLAMGVDAATKEKVANTIDKLVDGRLLTIDRVNDRNIVDLSHEAMMQGWKRFVKWRESERSLRQSVDEIEARYRKWQEQKSKKDKDYYLLNGPDLNKAKKLLKDSPEFLVGEFLSFVLVSLKYRKRFGLQLILAMIVPSLISMFSWDYFMREESVRQDYQIVENSQATRRERLAVLNLAGGCPATINYSWIPTYFRERVFGNCRSLSSKNLGYAKLNGTNLSGANFNGTNLSGANFNDTDLSGAQFIDANLNSTQLNGVNLSSAKLSHSQKFIDENPFAESFYSIRLSGAILVNADLSNISLVDADLRNANLKSANLSNVTFFNTDLSGAHLEGSNLENIVFSCQPSLFLRDIICDKGMEGHNNIKGIHSNKYTNWKGAKGWKNAKNIPPALRKQLDLPER
jgi:uncharacterized protein YjbI with pentapeptide repeats